MGVRFHQEMSQHPEVPEGKGSARGNFFVGHSETLKIEASGSSKNQPYLITR